MDWHANLGSVTRWFERVSSGPLSPTVAIQSLHRGNYIFSSCINFLAQLFDEMTGEMPTTVVLRCHLYIGRNPITT